MSEQNELSKTIGGMDDASLAALETQVRTAREGRRSGVDINSINASMSTEDRDRARAEIARVLKGQ
jgi:hypothetical protein